MLYEPRAFWSVGRIDTAAPLSPLIHELAFDRRHFFNGSRWPITLRHLLVAPIGYLLAQFDSGAAAINAQDYRNSAEAAIADAIVRIEAPQTVSYTKGPITTATLTPEPTWEPAPGAVAGITGFTAAGATLHGAYGWQFDHALDIPASGAIEFGLGAILPSGAAFVGQAPVVKAVVGFSESGGVVPGNQRVGGPFVLPELIDPTYGFPWGYDGWGAPGVGTASNLWNDATSLTARAWKKQRVTAGGANPVDRFTVHVDQTAWDAEIMTGVVNIYPGATGMPGAMGHNVPTRARVADGGTRAWWWRQGAPLSLVSPSMTPAMVYRLPQPITLAPGDKLAVTLQVPLAFDTAIVNPQPARVVQIGVSLCGEAAVEQ